MTWTDAATEAAGFGFNSFRDEDGRVRPLLRPFTSRTGDWMLQGGKIVATDGAGPRLALLVVLPETATLQGVR